MEKNGLFGKVRIIRIGVISQTFIFLVGLFKRMEFELDVILGVLKVPERHELIHGTGKASVVPFIRRIAFHVFNIRQFHLEVA